MAGIFISRGMKVGVPAGGLQIRIGEDGAPTASCTLHVHFDVCPTWLELAERHLLEAKARQAERIAAWAGESEDAKGAALEREFEASMQAIMAAAIAMDAFYAAIRKKAEIPETLVATWREKKTARPKQIAETLKVAFGLKDGNFAALRENLGELYRMRDRAVHPPNELGEAILHPELGVGVEWRFAFFRFVNAEALVRVTREMITALVTSATPKNKEVGAYARELRARLVMEAPMGPTTSS